MSQLVKGRDSQIWVVTVPLRQLKPSAYNPRHWDKQAIQQLTESIERFGLVDPILVNGSKKRKNIVIWWHFRLKIAKDLGYTEVPVVYLDIPNEAKEQELNLRLNRNTGDWDLELLKDFDLDLLLNVGFDESDLGKIWDDALGIEDDEFDTRREISEITEPKTKEWDIIQLGRHTLICWDAAGIEVVTKVLRDTKVHMLYCDPPYNIGFDYSTWLTTKGKYKGTKTDDSKTNDEYQAFLHQAYSNALTHCHKDAHIFSWCDQGYIGMIQALFSDMWLNNKRVCLWIKNNQNMTPHIAFNKCYEPCVYATRGSPYLSDRATNLIEVLNTEVGNGNRTIDDIEDLLDIWLVKRLPTNEYLHATEKPVTLHERPLRRCTKPGDVVLDLFWWSWSTLIACEQMGRTCFLVEHDPVFCDVIINRYLSLNPNNYVTYL